MARGAFTGEDDGTDNPLKSIIGPGETMNRAIFNDPASRAALLQIGLQMMQPIAMGQTVGGHIGQAIGSGGEEVTREEERQRKEDTTQEELALKERAAASREVEAGAYSKGMTLKSLTDRLQLEREKLDLAKSKAADAPYIADAEQIVKVANSTATDPNGEYARKYAGKTQTEIIKILKADEAAAKTGGSVTPTPTPATTGPAATTGPLALPPVAARVAGKTTYNGHVWDGTGWVPIRARDPLSTNMPLP